MYLVFFKLSMRVKAFNSIPMTVIQQSIAPIYVYIHQQEIKEDWGCLATVLLPLKSVFFLWIAEVLCLANVYFISDLHVQSLGSTLQMTSSVLPDPPLDHWIRLLAFQRLLGIRFALKYLSFYTLYAFLVYLHRYFPGICHDVKWSQGAGSIKKWLYLAVMWRIIVLNFLEFSDSMLIHGTMYSIVQVVILF